MADKGLRCETELVRTVAENPLQGEGHETIFQVQTLLSGSQAKDVSKQAQAPALVSGDAVPFELPGCKLMCQVATRY